MNLAEARKRTGSAQIGGQHRYNLLSYTFIVATEVWNPFEEQYVSGTYKLIMRDYRHPDGWHVFDDLDACEHFAEAWLTVYDPNGWQPVNEPVIAHTSAW